MDKREIGFTQGVVFAIALLIRNGYGYGNGNAEILWNESGFTEKDLEVCENYDADEVRKMLKP